MYILAKEGTIANTKKRGQACLDNSVVDHAVGGDDPSIGVELGALAEIKGSAMHIRDLVGFKISK